MIFLSEVVNNIVNFTVYTRQSDNEFYKNLKELRITKNIV